MHGRPRELPSRLAPGRPTDVCTSRFCTCCSNLSITADTFCRSMLLRALSRALVTCAMFLVTWHGAVEKQQDEGKGWRPPGTGPLSATQVDKPPGQAKPRWAQAAPAMSPGSAIDDPMDTRSAGHDTRSKSEDTVGLWGHAFSGTARAVWTESPPQSRGARWDTPHSQPWPLPAVAADVAWAEHSPPSWSRPSAPWRPPRPRGTPCAASSRPRSSCGWRSPRTLGHTPRSSAAEPEGGRRPLQDTRPPRGAAGRPSRQGRPRASRPCGGPGPRPRRLGLTLSPAPGSVDNVTPRASQRQSKPRTQPAARCVASFRPGSHHW